VSEEDAPDELLVLSENEKQVLVAELRRIGPVPHQRL
jgi:hypothetical protein